ncbi:unnamed protein product [Psylliodes chrysocephalus]|uniref:Selenoprotein T n=1 Tax=Psylliodes chrysocephalus TaxID=3402493 RepID=A0A9P0CZK5_9CUCU|nr:unnamed protein product [Psylliodes chrysocephala]
MSRILNLKWFWSLVLFLGLFIVSYANEDVPLSKLSQNVGTPTLKFQYCYSCGYKKMYDQYSTIVNQKYPYILVDGVNYDPPGLNMLIAKALGWIKMAFILCILANINIFEYINQPRPSWYVWCTENRLYACMMLFFLCNILEGQLIQSGAFEITLNDVPVWSKLETGRIPQPAELFQIIDSHMQFDSKIELNNYAK